MKLFLSTDHALYGFSLWLYTVPILFVLQDKMEVQTDSIKPGQSVVIIDDLLATGGNPFFA